MMDGSADGEMSTPPATQAINLGSIVLSDLIGKLVFAVIGFMGVSQAVDMLGLEMLSSFVAEIWGFIIPVFVGLGIFGVGYYLAGKAREFAKASNPDMAQPAYYGVLALSAIVGLKRMGFAGGLVDIGFGAVVIGLAVALGLAFGLGGQEAAAEYLANRKSKQ